MSEMKRPERWSDGIHADYYYADQADAYIAALERRLRGVCERYRELQAREVTNHDFECCIISAENFLESRVESEQKEQENG